MRAKWNRRRDAEPLPSSYMTIAANSMDSSSIYTSGWGRTAAFTTERGPVSADESNVNDARPSTPTPQLKDSVAKMPSSDDGGDGDSVSGWESTTSSLTDGTPPGRFVDVEEEMNFYLRKNAEHNNNTIGQTRLDEFEIAEYIDALLTDGIPPSQQSPIRAIVAPSRRDRRTKQAAAAARVDANRHSNLMQGGASSGGDPEYQPQEQPAFSIARQDMDMQGPLSQYASSTSSNKYYSRRFKVACYTSCLLFVALMITVATLFVLQDVDYLGTKEAGGSNNRDDLPAETAANNFASSHSGSDSGGTSNLRRGDVAPSASPSRSPPAPAFGVIRAPATSALVVATPSASPTSAVSFTPSQSPVQAISILTPTMILDDTTVEPTESDSNMDSAEAQPSSSPIENDRVETRIDPLERDDENENDENEDEMIIDPLEEDEEDENEETRIEPLEEEEDDEEANNGAPTSPSSSFDAPALFRPPSAEPAAPPAIAPTPAPKGFIIIPAAPKKDSTPTTTITAAPATAGPALPTASPSSATNEPTASPSAAALGVANDENSNSKDCRDDADFTFVVNGLPRNCAWLAGLKAQQIIDCPPECASTCQAC